MRAGGMRSNYKQEINYNMRTAPPTPIMDSSDPTMPHPYLPGYIEKRMPGFEKGTGQIRRPDVIIVIDPKKAPTQDNIKQIVEMKFPPDTLSAKQKADYQTIAGTPGKLTTLEPGMCDCDKEKPGGPAIPVEKLDALSNLLRALLLLISRGRTGGGPRGSPVPVPAY